MAYNCLGDGVNGFLKLIGEGASSGPHCLELYEKGGQRFLQLTLGAENPGGGGIVLRCPLSRHDAECLADGAERLLHRLSD